MIATKAHLLPCHRYHEIVKDMNLMLTPWSPRHEDQGSCSKSTRQLKFFKPVNLPGLKSTRGIKHQICHYLKEKGAPLPLKILQFSLYLGIGLIVCSSTQLEDVPAAKTFFVEDAVMVQYGQKSFQNISVSHNSCTVGQSDWRWDG